jgi:hypothetical protein
MGPSCHHETFQSECRFCIQYRDDPKYRAFRDRMPTLKKLPGAAITPGPARATLRPRGCGKCGGGQASSEIQAIRAEHARMDAKRREARRKALNLFKPGNSE